MTEYDQALEDILQETGARDDLTALKKKIDRMKVLGSGYFAGFVIGNAYFAITDGILGNDNHTFTERCLMAAMGTVFLGLNHVVSRVSYSMGEKWIADLYRKEAEERVNGQH